MTPKILHKKFCIIFQHFSYNIVPWLKIPDSENLSTVKKIPVKSRPGNPPIGG